jgi:hypothetical protein
MTKYHVLVKATVNVLLEVEGSSPRQVAELVSDGGPKPSDIIGRAVYKNMAFGVHPPGVIVNEVSLDEGANKEIEVAPYIRGEVDFEKARTFMDGPDRPRELRENFKSCVSRVAIANDPEVRGIVELSDRER